MTPVLFRVVVQVQFEKNLSHFMCLDLQKPVLYTPLYVRTYLKDKY